MARNGTVTLEISTDTAMVMAHALAEHSSWLPPWSDRRRLEKTADTLLQGLGLVQGAGLRDPLYRGGDRFSSFLSYHFFEIG